MPSVLTTSDGPFTAWDLFYFSIFDRWLNMFDMLALIVIFIDGLDRKKPIALSLIFSWIIRNIGGVIWGIVRVVTYNNPESWRYTTGVPTAAWYIGEILLDSYTFQKAYAVSGMNKWMKGLSYAGFVPLVLGKLAFVGLRYIYCFKAATQQEYFAIANPFDAAVILLTSWSDLLCCIVIVYAGAKSHRFKRGGDDFVSNLVKTTELRMVVCTFLAIFAATLILSDANCDTDSSSNGRCQFPGAREILVNTVYSLYYVDYLVTKYHKVMKIERSGILDFPAEKEAPADFKKLPPTYASYVESNIVSAPSDADFMGPTYNNSGTKRNVDSSMYSKYTTGTLEADVPSSSDPANLIPDSQSQAMSMTSAGSVSLRNDSFTGRF